MIDHQQETQAKCDAATLAVSTRVNQDLPLILSLSSSFSAIDGSIHSESLVDLSEEKAVILRILGGILYVDCDYRMNNMLPCKLNQFKDLDHS